MLPTLAKPGWPWAMFTPAYGGAVLARRFLYDAGWLPSHAPPLPTFCVGALEVGGSGKTPVAAWLLRWLTAQGLRPGLLTRGYGRPRAAAALVVRRWGEAALPEAVGDEAAMLVGDGLDVPVAACARRVVGAQALMAAGCDALVMDDGFSHRALQRHVDIVVMRDAMVGRARERLLPWGRLREPLSSLRRAQVVWLHRKHGGVLADGVSVDDSATASAALAWKQRWAPQAMLVRSRAVYRLETLAGAAVPLAEGGLLAACGVGDPEGFRRSLADAGARVLDLMVFADHHRYDASDVEKLMRAMTRCRAEALVVTAKDAIKLRELSLLPQSLLVWRASLCVEWGMTQFVTLMKDVIKQ